MHRLRHRFLCSDLFSNGRFLPIQSLTILAPFLPFSVVPTPFDGRFRFCRFFPAGVFTLPGSFSLSIVFFVTVVFFRFDSSQASFSYRFLCTDIFRTVVFYRSGPSQASFLYRFLCADIFPTAVFYRSDPSQASYIPTRYCFVRMCFQRSFSTDPTAREDIL